MTTIHEIFRETIEYYGITGKELSSVTGITEGHISEFRRGKAGISTKVLEQLLEGMDIIAPGSRTYFCNLLTGKKQSKPSVNQLIRQIERLEPEDYTQILVYVVDKIKTLIPGGVKLVPACPPMLENDLIDDRNAKVHCAK